MTIETKLEKAASLLDEVREELNANKETSPSTQDLKTYLSQQLSKKKQTNIRVYEHLLSAALHIVKGEGAGLTLFHREKERLIFEAAIGLGSEDIVGYEVPLEGSVHGLAFALNETQVSASLHKQIEEQASATFSNVLVTPIRSGEEVIGTMSAVNKFGAQMFDEKDIEVFQKFALVVGALIESRTEATVCNPALISYDTLLDQLAQTLTTQPVATITKLLKALDAS